VKLLIKFKNFSNYDVISNAHAFFSFLKENFISGPISANFFGKKLSVILCLPLYLFPGFQCFFILKQNCKVNRPSIIFIDEIDSITRKRTSHEDETTRRIKSELLQQFEGISNDSKNEPFIIGRVLKYLDFSRKLLNTRLSHVNALNYSCVIKCFLPRYVHHPMSALDCFFLTLFNFL
jgi:hypothetical protein